MTVDTQRSLITQLYTYLTTDTALKTAMGGTVRCYLTWAKTDVVLPYLVHRIDMSAGIPFPERNATYYLDIWSASDDANEVTAIRKAIIELLDEVEFNTTEVKNCKLRLQTDGFIPEPEEGIYHYALQFNLSLWRQSETLIIINR